MATSLSGFAAAISPDPYLLGVAALVDLAIGDPSYAWHPVRLVGRVLTWMEDKLRGAGLDGYAGGVLLFVGLSAASVAAITGSIGVAAAVSPTLGWVAHVFVLYSLLALGDLLHHVWKIERAVRAGDLPRARVAVSALVGRDTDRMDAGACRRAAVESLGENLTDGFVSPVFWYVLAGIPGLVLFKVVSTMDSMVGYKTPRYLRFGWCGARLDDVMNFVPARLTWLVIARPRHAAPDLFRPKGVASGPSSACAVAWPEFRVERGGDRWRGAAPNRRPDLARGTAGDGSLDWRSDAIRSLKRASDVTRAMMIATMTGLVVSVAAIAVINRLGAW